MRTAEPADAAELAALLRAADAVGDAVVLHGGGTLQGMGNAPLRADVAIATRRLDAVHVYDHRDLTVGVGAGMTVAALDRLLEAQGQFVPLDVPFPDRATIGGTLAAGWAGPRRAAYGRPRDLLIGSTVALADGTLASSGGMVVKNVSGYDLGKVFVGSLGTLGALVRANFKTLPRPAARRLATSPLEPETEDRAIAHLGTLSVEPAAALLLHTPKSATLVSLFEGSEAFVERGTRELRSALGAAGVERTALADGGDAARTFQRHLDAMLAAGAGSVVLRAPGAPSTVAERGRRARSFDGIETIADLRTGDLIVRFALPAGVDEALRTAVAALRGAIGPAHVLAGGHGALDAWGGEPDAIVTMRALKERFDPRRTLAPGRFVGGI